MTKNKVDPIYDLEDHIMECWGVVDDLDLLLYQSDTDDEQMNLMMGLRSLYQLKFQRMWDTFEKVCKEYNA